MIRAKFKPCRVISESSLRIHPESLIDNLTENSLFFITILKNYVNKFDKQF